MTDTDAAYLAGILDGEGCISLYRRNGYVVPSVRVANTNRPLIDRVCTILTTHGIEYCVTHDDRSGNRKPAWELHCENRPRVKAILNLVLPYLVGKAPQALLVLKFCEHDGRAGLPQNISETLASIRALNMRGRVK